VRLAYLAYSRALLRWDDPSSPEAAASLRRRLEALFDEDFRDAESGLYPRHLIEALPWREYAQAVPRLLADLPRTRARMERGDFREIPDPAAAERYPPYYARNFHYQSEGYLGHTSAALYDLQVELLFGGTADVMRRRVIPPVVRVARARNASAAQPCACWTSPAEPGTSSRCWARRCPARPSCSASTSRPTTSPGRARCCRAISTSP